MNGMNLITRKKLINIEGRLNLNRETVTLSGFSAGSSMATQFHIAHSSLFRGVGLFSQGKGSDSLIT